MPSYGIDRSAEDLKRELAAIFRELKDPRVGGMLSIVKLELARDYSTCKVYISAMEGKEAAGRAVSGLSSASGFIRRELSRRMSIRHVPALSFVADDSIAYSAHIADRLKALELPEQEAKGDAQEGTR